MSLREVLESKAKSRFTSIVKSELELSRSHKKPDGEHLYKSYLTNYSYAKFATLNIDWRTF